MVVQCNNCQSKFRIADEKVTERGVRVRCTSCKNVFAVRKAGSAGTDPAPGLGHTMDLSALGAKALAKPGARSAPPAARPAAAAARPAAASPPRPALPRPAPAPAPAGDGDRFGEDDLFGMSELTGESPLGEATPAARRPATARPAASPAPPQRTAPKPAPTTGPISSAPKPPPSFGDLDLELDDGPPPVPERSAASKPARTPGAPAAGAAALREPSAFDDDVAPPPPEDSFAATDDGASAHDGPGQGSGGSAGFEASLDNSFDAASAGPRPADAAGSKAASRAEPEKPAARARPDQAPEEPHHEVSYSASRELVSSALTGLVGAALAVAVILGAALSEEAPSGWLGFGTASDIVATRVVSGLYDTAGGKPVFYVRGRVENRGQKVRGPVRVVAELVGGSSADARAEAIAGAEPTPEDVYGLHSPSDAEKLARSLEASAAIRRVEPGGSLPFFAVIAEPPADLENHKLRVRLEPVDAWVPPQSKAAGKVR